MNWSARLVLSLVFASVQTVAVAAEWPVFKGNNQRSGFVQQDVEVENFQLQWQFQLPTAIASSPVAMGEQLFVAGENGNLYAFDLTNNQLQWIYPTAGAISSTPAVSEGLVYMLSMDGTFYALNTSDGMLVWSFSTLGEERFAARHYMGISSTDQPIRDPWDFWLSSPLIADGKVYFGSSDNHLYALDAATGKLFWAYKTGGLVHSSPALADGVIVIGDWYGIVHALDAETGKVIWQLTTEQDLALSQWLGIQSSPVIDGDRVYVGSRDSYLYALSLTDGEQLWRYAMPSRSWVVPTPSFDDSRIYLGSSIPGFVLAVDKHSGEEVWRHDTKVWSYSSPLVLGKHVLSATMKGDLLALDSASGELVWQYQTDSARTDNFGVINMESGGFDNQRMQGPSLHHALYSYLEYVTHLGVFLSSPAWHNGKLIITSTNGELLIFSASEDD